MSCDFSLLVVTLGERDGRLLELGVVWMGQGESCCHCCPLLMVLCGNRARVVASSVLWFYYWEWKWGNRRVLHTTPQRQSLYLELSSRISKKRQQAQERLYDELPQQSLVTSRTGMMIDCSLSSLTSLTCREILI